jgi:predicted HTH transcriptional regulator
VLKYSFSVIFYRSKTKSNSIEEVDTNPAQIRHKSGTNPAQIQHKSGTNPAQIRHKSGTNPAQIRQEWILEYLNKNKDIRNFIIAKEFSINRDTARSDLKDLIKQGKIIKKGAGNNVWYELKSK